MVHKDGAGVYGEVDALVTLLGYATANAGCCKVALHPRWGSAFYPASLLTKAPLDATACRSRSLLPRYSSRSVRCSSSSVR